MFMKNLNNLVHVLQNANIDFVIVGGYSAVLHGSSMVTQDLDICIRFDEAAMWEEWVILKRSRRTL